MTSLPRIPLVLVALILVSFAAFAQTTSSLTGTVTLDNGPVPGATVTITSSALLGSRTDVTDVNGNYNFGALPPGTYTVEVTLEGTQPVRRTVQVPLSGTARADAALSMSAVTDVITITASAPALLETTEKQTNLQQDLINNLPVQRTLQAVTSLAPGVVISNSGGSGASGGVSSGSIAIAGAPAYDSVFMVNGAAVNENLRGQTHNLFIEDAIQETTVTVGAVSAEFGRFTGGVVNAITKSGGNEFSGSIRDSLSNDRWTAEGELSPGPNVDQINHVYEGTLGGRIIRDRLWFFVAGRSADREQQQTFANDANTPYIFGLTDRRFEAKLTGQITQAHTLVGSYLKSDQTNSNLCPFLPCLEGSTLDVARELPNNFTTAHYSGILTDSLLVEANWSKKYYAFVGSGGDFSSPAQGTPIITALGTGEGYLGAPIFCGFCSTETRNNDLWSAKATYYLASKSFGTHSIAAGYEDWSEQRKANNFQSGSNFLWYTLGDDEEDLIAPTCTGADAASIRCHPILRNGDLIKWNPIFEQSQGSDFTTRSLYVNDKWDLNANWNFNVGLRYDKNEGVDSSGTTVTDDSALSPRLGLIYDIRGDGRYRVNASYSTYVSRIAETVGGGTAGGGNPSYLYYQYTGPDINLDHSLTTEQALAQAFEHFFANGGVTQEPLFGVIAGLSSRINGSLKSPAADEISLGFGSQISNNLFFRVDLTRKDWKDFYSIRVDQTTGQVPGFITDPDSGDEIPVGLFDIVVTENSDFYKRRYEAATLQAAWRPVSRLNFGANYTWSKLQGNVRAETAGNGPVGEVHFSYPEFRGYEQESPYGYLPGDQRHKVRAWAGYDQPTPFGTFNFSILQRFDSGASYSAIGQIDTATLVEEGYVADDLTYTGVPQTISYFFSDRGAFRWDDVHATDLAVNYELPISRFVLFAQGKVLNTFNNQAQTAGNTGVTVFTQNPFNPFTETPSECPRGTASDVCIAQGYNWRLGPTFGDPRNPTTSGGVNLLAPNGDFQLPRTYFISLGARF
jgi:outer membrane receptor protein involved in Fe transport